MTLAEIHEVVSNIKPCSFRHCQRYLVKLGIKPFGTIRQRPQQYPHDAPARILSALGLAPEPSPEPSPGRPPGRQVSVAAVRMATLEKLRRAKKKAGAK